MKVFRSLAGIKLDEPTCVTLGVFDGIHIGHQRLLRSVIDVAKSRKLLSVALTFDPHPEAVVLGKSAPPLLTTTEEKLDCFANFGIKVAVVAPFDKTLANTSARDFVKRILLDKLKTQYIVIGLESTFGKDAHGNAASLTTLGEAMGFQVQVMEPVMLDNVIVSSTAIRQAINAGEMESATKMLGRPYEISGPVLSGDGRGKELGFPTANLAPPEGKVLPPDGVYAGLAQVADDRQGPAGQGQKEEILPDHLGVIYIGKRPTFGGRERIIEAHICEEVSSLYGKTLRLSFVARLRGDETFANREALVKQMAKDTQQALDIVTRYYSASAG